MNESRKKEIATFRFSVISDLVVGVCLAGEELERLISLKAARSWQIPYSHRKTISKSTIRRWIKRYQESGGKITSLYPSDREDRGNSRVIDPETGAALLQLKTNHPKATVPELIDKLQRLGGTITNKPLTLSTVYRFLHQHGGLKTEVKKIDRRRFEAEFPNDIWQSDIMHGPRVRIEHKWKKTYLIAFIDDHSRLVPYAGFYLSETLSSFLSALSTALQSRGLPRKLYTDNGSAYRSKHLEYIMASLQITLVRAKPYSPQGKGKIERFFKTVRQGFLKEETADTLPLLNERFAIWLQDHYQTKVHSSTAETPIKRFVRHLEMIRSAPENLSDYFRHSVLRTVTQDRVVHLEGRLYEAPVDLIAERIELLYHPEKPGRVEARFKGKSYGELRLLDPGVNVRVLRDKTEGSIKLKSPDDHPKTPKTGRLFTKKPFDPTEDHPFF